MTLSLDTTTIAAVTRGNPTPINYVYKDEVPISTVVTQRTPKVILHAVPPATVQDAQQLFDGSDQDLAALVEDMKDLKEELKQLKEKEKCERDVSFRWELLTRAIKGTHNSLILNYLIPTN
jgi:hypothetical protein